MNRIAFPPILTPPPNNGFAIGGAGGIVGGGSDVWGIHGEPMGIVDCGFDGGPLGAERSNSSSSARSKGLGGKTASPATVSGSVSLGLSVFASAVKSLGAAVSVSSQISTIFASRFVSVRNFISRASLSPRAAILHIFRGYVSSSGNRHSRRRKT